MTHHTFELAKYCPKKSSGDEWTNKFTIVLGCCLEPSTMQQNMQRTLLPRHVILVCTKPGRLIRAHTREPPSSPRPCHILGTSHWRLAAGTAACTPLEPPWPLVLPTLFPVACTTKNSRHFKCHMGFTDAVCSTQAPTGTFSSPNVHSLPRYMQ